VIGFYKVNIVPIDFINSQIKEAASIFRITDDQVNIIRREVDNLEILIEFANFFYPDIVKVNTFIIIEGNIEEVIFAREEEISSNFKERLPEFDEFDIFRIKDRFSEREVSDCFEEIGFSNSVFSGNDTAVIGEIEIEIRIIPEVFQSNFINKQD